MTIKEIFRLLRGLRGRAAQPVPESDEECRARLLRRRKEKELENFWRYDGTAQDEICVSEPPQSE